MDCAPNGSRKVALAGGEDEGGGVCSDDGGAEAAQVGHELRERLTHERGDGALQP